jgi:DNA-binding transcriptional ArsR family regulator
MVEYRTQQLDRVFHALAHPARRQILRRIARTEFTVGELAQPFAMSLEAVSKHIEVLEQARLLKRTRSGRVHRCRLRPAPLRGAMKVLRELQTLWGDRLDALEGLLDELQAPGSKQ